MLDAGCFGVCAIDNTQIMTPRKYQRAGCSSKMNMYTTRLFFYVVNPENLELHLWPLDKVPITYMDQPIPPAMGMPLYHLCGPITVSNFEQKPMPSYVSFSAKSQKIKMVACLQLVQPNITRLLKWAIEDDGENQGAKRERDQ